MFPSFGSSSSSEVVVWEHVVEEFVGVVWGLLELVPLVVVEEELGRRCEKIDRRDLWG